MIGAIAEYALAKHYGKTVLQDWCENKSYTDGDPRSIPCDVGKNIHVRATSNPRARFLVIHEARGQAMEPVERRRFRPTDTATGTFVMARVDEATRTVVFLGWQNSGWVQENVVWNNTSPGFFNTDRHAFTCPIEALEPMNTIPPEDIWSEK